MLTMLIIEDSENDAYLLDRSFKLEGLACSFQRVQSGREAISYLEGRGDYADREISPFPDVIFTDLKMPVMDGFDMLEWLKTHPKCSTLPVIVFSSSNDDGDIEKAYQLGANAYIVKPTTLPELQKVIRTTHDFWKQCSKTEVALATKQGY